MNKYTYLIASAIVMSISIHGYASITTTDMAAQKKGDGTVTSYVDTVDNSKKTITVNGTSYAVTSSTNIVSDGKASNLSNIHKGTRVKVVPEDSQSKKNTVKQILILQQPSTK